MGRGHPREYAIAVTALDNTELPKRGEVHFSKSREYTGIQQLPTLFERVANMIQLSPRVGNDSNQADTVSGRVVFPDGSEQGTCEALPSRGPYRRAVAPRPPVTPLRNPSKSKLHPSSRTSACRLPDGMHKGAPHVGDHQQGRHRAGHPRAIAGVNGCADPCSLAQRQQDTAYYRSARSASSETDPDFTGQAYRVPSSR